MQMSPALRRHALCSVNGVPRGSNRAPSSALPATVAAFTGEHRGRVLYRSDSAPVEIYRLTLRRPGRHCPSELARREYARVSSAPGRSGRDRRLRREPRADRDGRSTTVRDSASRDDARAWTRPASSRSTHHTDATRLRGGGGRMAEPDQLTRRRTSMARLDSTSPAARQHPRPGDFRGPPKLVRHATVDAHGATDPRGPVTRS